MTESKIRTVHLLGALGSGGRESLLLDIIENSPPEIDYSLWCFKRKEETAIKFENFGVDVVTFGVTSKWDLKGLFRLFKRLQSEDIDILHLHGPRAQIPGRLMGTLGGATDIVSTQHGIQEMFPENLQRLEYATRGLDSRTIAVSEGVRRSFVGNSNPTRWTTIHNGLDVEAFSSAVDTAAGGAVRDRHGLGNELIFLNVGRYVPPKAQHDLIAAMDAVQADLPPAHLFIVGGRGAMKERLRDDVRERKLDDSVTVTGHVENIHEYYAAADVFVSSSIKEGLPIVLLEAMAAELPVVATTIPGVKELIVDDECGILVPPEHPERLGEAMSRMVDSGTRERFAAAGYERVANEFDVSDTAAGYAAIYNELAKRSNA